MSAVRPISAVRRVVFRTCFPLLRRWPIVTRGRQLPPAEFAPDAAVGAVAIEQVVGVERNDTLLRRHEMDAGALHLRHAEIEAIQELDAEDPEHRSEEH